MKVLWFSNNPCGSIRRFSHKVIRGGWLISLEDEIKQHPDIELSISFFSSVKESPYEYDGVRYYPIYQPKAKTKIGRILERFRSIESIDKEKLPTMLNVVKNIQPDLIHIHGTEESFGLILKEILDIPIVISIQGLIAPYTEKYFSGYPKNVICRYESLLNKIRGVGINNSYRNFSERSPREMDYLGRCRYIIGRTIFDRRVPLLANPQMVYFHSEEIMRKPFYKAKWLGGNKQKSFTIVTTISSGVYKGFETLLHTAALLKKYADFDFKWQIIGYDSNSQWVHIAEKYKKIRSADVNIHFMGRCTAEQMVEILINADVYCHVSHIENSPNSVCEAMLLGMPVIATSTGGTQSLLTDGLEGYLIQDGEPYICAGTIVDIQKNRECAKIMGEKAYKRALERHNPEKIGNTLLCTYKEILLNFRKLHSQM